MRGPRILALIGGLLLVGGGTTWLLARQASEARGSSRAAPPGADPLAAERPSGALASIESEPGDEPPSRASDEPTVESEPKAWLEVRIVAVEDKLPVAGALLLLARVDEHEWTSDFGPVFPDGPFAFPQDFSVMGHVPVGTGARRVRGSTSAVLTDAGGNAEIETAPGSAHRLFVESLPSVHLRSESIEIPALAPGERRELELALVTRDDLRWFGRVVDDASGAPIAGACANWILRATAPSPAATSSADGILTLEFASWEEARVRVDSPETLGTEIVLAGSNDSPERALPIRLVRPASVEVRVHDALGAPVPRVPVEAIPKTVPDGRITILPHQARDATDENGVCLLEGLTPREELDVAVRSGIGLTQRQTVTLAPGERRALAFEVGAGCSVQGLALDEGGEALAALDVWRLPLRGQPAYLEPEHERTVVDKARTDRDGRFRFENVPAGEWWIGPAPIHRRDGLAALATRVTIAPDERVLTLTLVCRAARYIRGRVLGPDGKSAAASVEASQGGVCMRAASSDGRFVLGPMASGEWLVRACGEGSGTGLSEPVRAQAGGEDVSLHLEPGGSVFGVVRDEHGMVVDGAEVALAPDGHGWSRSTQSTEYGSFALHGLAPGPHTLCARKGGAVGVLGPVVVQSGGERTGLDIALAPGAELRVRLGGTAVEARQIRVALEDVVLLQEGLDAGAERRLTLPPGSARVQLLRSNDAGELELLEERSVELARGGSAVVEFRVRGAADSGAR